MNQGGVIKTRPDQCPRTTFLKKPVRLVVPMQQLKQEMSENDDVNEETKPGR